MMSVFSWRSTSWSRNAWTSAVLAVVTAQILWVAVGFGYGFETADRLTTEYLWYLVGTLFALFFVVRAPGFGRPSETETRPKTESDA